MAHTSNMQYLLSTQASLHTAPPLNLKPLWLYDGFNIKSLHAFNIDGQVLTKIYLGRTFIPGWQAKQARTEE